MDYCAITRLRPSEQEALCNHRGQIAAHKQHRSHRKQLGNERRLVFKRSSVSRTQNGSQSSISDEERQEGECRRSSAQGSVSERFDVRDSAEYAPPWIREKTQGDGHMESLRIPRARKTNSDANAGRLSVDAPANNPSPSFSSATRVSAGAATVLSSKRSRQPPTGLIPHRQHSTVGRRSSSQHRNTRLTQQQCHEKRSTTPPPRPTDNTFSLEETTTSSGRGHYFSSLAVPVSSWKIRAEATRLELLEKEKENALLKEVVDSLKCENGLLSSKLEQAHQNNELLRTQLRKKKSQLNVYERLVSATCTAARALIKGTNGIPPDGGATLAGLAGMSAQDQQHCSSSASSCRSSTRSNLAESRNRSQSSCHSAKVASGQHGEVVDVDLPRKTRTARNDAPRTTASQTVYSRPCGRAVLGSQDGRENGAGIGIVVVNNNNERARLNAEHEGSPSRRLRAAVYHEDASDDKRKRGHDNGADGFRRSAGRRDRHAPPPGSPAARGTGVRPPLAVGSKSARADNFDDARRSDDQANHEFVLRRPWGKNDDQSQGREIRRSRSQFHVRNGAGRLRHPHLVHSSTTQNIACDNEELKPQRPLSHDDAHGPTRCKTPSDHLHRALREITAVRIPRKATADGQETEGEPLCSVDVKRVATAARTDDDPIQRMRARSGVTSGAERDPNGSGSASQSSKLGALWGQPASHHHHNLSPTVPSTTECAAARQSPDAQGGMATSKTDFLHYPPQFVESDSNSKTEHMDPNHALPQDLSVIRGNTAVRQSRRQQDSAPSFSSASSGLNEKPLFATEPAGQCMAAAVESDDDESDSSSSSSSDLISPPLVPRRSTRPSLVPRLGLSQDTVGHGVWLTGEATSGNTYTDVPT